jgi:hypothetical protein
MAPLWCWCSPPSTAGLSEGDQQEALRRGDRLSLPRLQLVPRANCLNWGLPVSYGLPGRIAPAPPRPGAPVPQPLPQEKCWGRDGEGVNWKNAKAQETAWDVRRIPSVRCTLC